jgi:hypothetical protein
MTVTNEPVARDFWRDASARVPLWAIVAICIVFPWVLSLWLEPEAWPGWPTTPDPPIFRAGVRWGVGIGCMLVQNKIDGFLVLFARAAARPLRAGSLREDGRDFGRGTVSVFKMLILMALCVGVMSGMISLFNYTTRFIIPISTTEKWKVTAELYALALVAVIGVWSLWIRFWRGPRAEDFEERFATAILRVPLWVIAVVCIGIPAALTSIVFQDIRSIVASIDPDFPLQPYLVFVGLGAVSVQTQIDGAHHGVLSANWLVSWVKAIVLALASMAAFYLLSRYSWSLLFLSVRRVLQSTPLTPNEALVAVVAMYFGAQIAVLTGLWGIWRKFLIPVQRPSAPQGQPELGSVSIVDSIGRFFESVGNEGAKVGMLFKGMLWFALCVLLLLVGWWFLSSVSSVRLMNIIGWAFVVVGALVLFKALQFIGPALKGTLKPSYPRVSDINARTATELETETAARGHATGSSVDSRTYRD